VRILFRELGDRADSEKFEVAEDGGPDGNQILQGALAWHGLLLLSLSIRHEATFYRIRADPSSQKIQSKNPVKKSSQKMGKADAECGCFDHRPANFGNSL
jgi:hypothetical protein